MIVEQVREFVESECKKPTSHYGYNACIHLRDVNGYAKILANELGANLEIVELASWLHDIGSIICGRENHHITGAEIAEKKLKELGYDSKKIELVKQCILSHRGSQKIKRESVEAQILADADGMSHFKDVFRLYMVATKYENLSHEEAMKSVLGKLNRTYAKLSPEARKIIEKKYLAALELLK